MIRWTGQLCLLGAIFAFAGDAAAQSTMPGAFSPAGSSLAAGSQTDARMAFEHYSSFSGTLGAVVPLHHVGGRGEAGFDLVWNLQPGWLADRVSPNYSTYVDASPYPSDNIAGAPGNWYALSGPGYVYSRTGAGWQSCSGTYELANTITTVVFVTPGGSQVSLTDAATGGAVKNVPNNVCGTQPASWDAGRGKTFHSTDGSQIQFNSDINVMEQNLSNGGYGVARLSGTLVFPNGVTYRIDSSVVSWIRDRHGNLTNLTYANPTTYQLYIDWFLPVALLTRVTDSLNNVTNINYSDSTCGGCLTLTYTGAGSNVTHQVQVITGILSSSTLRSGYGLKTIDQLFPGTNQYNGHDYGSGTYTPTVASTIKMADGNQYTFLYNSYGEVAQVTLPTGGAVQYDYGDGSNGTGSGYQSSATGVLINRRLQARREYANGISNAVTASSNYVVSYQSGETSDKITDNDASGNAMRQTVHTMYGAATDALNMGGTSCNAWNEGLEATTTVGTSSTPSMLGIANTYVTQSGCMSNPQLSYTTKTLNGLQSKISFAFDSYGNLTDEQDFDWGSGGNSGGLIRHQKMTYLQTASYLATTVNLVHLPLSAITLNGAGTQVAETTWVYDANSAVDAPGIIYHDSTYGTGFNTRGNVSEVNQWVSGSAFVVDNYLFDIGGNVTSHTYNHVTENTTASYNDDGINRYAYPTTVTDALGNKTTATYDYAAGQPTSVKDANGNTTSYTYNDPLDRVTQVVEPTTGQTNVTYPAAYWTVAYHDQASAGDKAVQTQDAGDGFGRLLQHRQLVDSQHLMVIGQGYDGLGRLQCTANPSLYYTPNWSPDGYGYTTCRTYDALGRIVSVTAPDGGVTTTSYGTQTTPTVAQTMTVTDPASKATLTATDALGRVTAVTEDVSGTPLHTYYGVDALGNLTSVLKCPATGTCNTSTGQSRTFVYDGMSRLISATNPESGTVTYSYFSNGTAMSTLQSRTDSRSSNNTTTYQYDGDNRLTGITYQDGTPNVTYGFDAVGNLGATSAGNVATSTSFDVLGRPIYSSLQIGSGSKYTMSYSNDLAGDVTMETYPSGRQVTTNFDPSMRPTTMTGALGGTNTKYVQQVGYYPQGSVYYWQYGNNLWPVESYTKNLQPYVDYASVNNDNSKYLLYLQDNWTTNGVVGSGVDCYGAAVASGSMTCISEGYGYDNLNRLTSAGETFYQNPSSGAGYSRSFHYDEYGNMSVSAYANGPASGLMPQTSHNPFNTANNRLTSATYDARGNMTLIAANSVQMAYDGESRQTQTVDPGNGQTATYLYDASGQRVQKQVGGVTTVYVHDVYGQLVATYNSAGITPVCTTCYLTYDQIGSVRLITDQNANVVGRHDYVPYGEEIFSGTGGRSGNGFGSDATVAQMFTGQERDGGTAVLDYFNARHLSAVLGSFTQPDPGNAGADITRPQSWNAYAYVLGNPLGLVDPSGLSMIDCGGGVVADACVTSQAPAPLDPLWWGSSSNPFNPNGGISFSVVGTGVGDRHPQPVSAPVTTTLIPAKTGNASLLPKQGINWFTLPGTHYCGLGGGGIPTTRVDEACAAHDLCYENASVTWRNNVRLARTTPQQSADIRVCDSRLEDRIRHIPWPTSAEAGQATLVSTWFGFSAYSLRP